MSRRVEKSRRVLGWPVAAPLALLALLYGCGGGNPVAPLVPADGHSHHEMIVQTLPLAGVRGVVLDVPVIFDLRIEQGAAESLWLRLDEVVARYLETPVRNGILELTYPFDLSHASRPPLPIEAVLTVIELDTIELRDVGTITAAGLEVDRLALSSRGTGEIRVSGLSAAALEADLLSGGPVEVAGEVVDQRARLAGSGAYEAAELASREATVEVSAAGSATVRVARRLQARISGSGSVYYYGDPAVESSISGSGSVVRLGG